MAEEMTPGETIRRFDRIERDQRAADDRITSVTGQMVPAAQYEIAHQALVEKVAHVEADMKAGFDRVDRTSRERKAALEARDAELAAEIKAVREDQASHARGRTGAVANWITGAGVIIALIALVVTILTARGGR